MGRNRNRIQTLGSHRRACGRRPSPDLENRIQQDNRFVKKRVVASQWSNPCAER